ncbi:hypothetical protein [Phenylobacterium sp.]|uniref:hypothetical protein n=1 Tax=Phenylobacterium sp. TaxID=1871053 RepID=UPI0025E01392|nr:hypothetical protein [Phenylobacterium sp.]
MKLACLTLALSLATSPAFASIADDVLSGSRDESTLSCAQLAGEIGQIEGDLRDMARARRKETSDRFGSGPLLYVGGIVIPADLVSGTPGRLESGLQAAAQRRATREARARRSLLTGLYLSKDCHRAGRRYDVPGQRGLGA